ncbi:MAG TPA: copper transporter [Streptosporangiaceae bacterium]
MIDFRYHLVSIVAVFLALAIGIVIGSTSVLKGAVLSGLQKTSAAEKSRIDSLYAQNGQLKQQLNAAESFASASEHVLLDGLLDGQRVVLVAAPGASGGVVSGVQNALTTAGATVTGQVQFQTQFFAVGAESSLDTLNRQLTPAGVTLRGGSPQADAGELIASAILTKNSVDHPLTGNAGSTDQAILNGYAAGGYLSTSPRPTGRATLAVVIIPATPPSTSDANVASQTLVTLAQQLNLAGSGTVVAGQLTGSGAGSAIDVMRAGGRGGHLSSVDNADTPNGQIVVAQALYEQLADGKSGSYGSLPGATQPGPSPAPVPSTTPTTTTSASTQAPASQRPVAGK